MAHPVSRTTPPSRGRTVKPARRSPLIVGIPLLLLFVVALGAWFWVRPATARPITRLETQDFHALAWNPGEPQTVLFGHHDGMLQSTDGGRTWGNAPLKGADAMNLAVSPAAPERMYAAGHGVFLRSDDGGVTWNAPESTIQGADLHGFAQNPRNPDQLFAIDVNLGLMGSTDGGTNWNVVTPGPPGAAIAFSADGSTLLSSAADGVRQSTDGGVTWVPSGTGLPSRAQVISVAAASDGAMFAGTTQGLFRRDGATDRWTATNLSTPVLAVAPHPSQPQIVLALDQQGWVYRSETGGVSW